MTQERYTVDEIKMIIDHCRASCVRTFVYGELQLVFDGNKSGGAAQALRSPELRRLLEGQAP